MKSLCLFSMFLSLVLFGFSLVLTASVAFGFTSINSLETIIPEFTDRTCLLTDLDETLWIPQNSHIFRPALDDRVSQLIKTQDKRLRKVLAHECKEALAKTKFEILEPESLLKIHNLSKSIPFKVFGITSRGGSCMIEETNKTLNQLTIGKINQKDILVKDLFSVRNLGLELDTSQGVIYTNRQKSKGAVIQNLLKKNPRLCHKLIFVDDYLPNISSVDHLKKHFPEIEIKVFHYTKAQNLFSPLDEMLQDIQLEHFINKLEFMDNQKAFEIFSKE